MDRLTKQNFDLAYNQWVKINGTGRNFRGEYFGRWLTTMFLMPKTLSDNIYYMGDINRVVRTVNKYLYDK